MKKIIDKKTLGIIAESQKFGINDRLSGIIEKQKEYSDELSEEELSLVSAASGTDYEKFMQMLNNKK